MKNILLILLLLGARLSYAQMAGSQDTVFYTSDHLHLPDVVVLDEWTGKHQPGKSPHDHQLEMQLKQLKGINLISRGNFAQEAVYRGQQDARLQVKLNGMRIYSACTDRMDPATSYVAANNLQSAEVASACESSCSNSGLAGSLNLELKQARFDPSRKWRWGLSQKYFSNTEGLVSAFNLENQKGKFAWRLNATWQKHGNYSAGGGAEIRYSQNQKQNLALNSTYRLSDKEFIKLDVIYDLASDVGYPALPMDVGRARALIAGVTYSNHKALWKFGRYDLKVYHNDVYHEMDDTKRENVFMHMDMPGWSQTTGAILNAHDWIAGKHKLSATAEYYTNSRRAEMTMYPPNAEEPPMYMLTWPHTRIHGMATGITDHWHFGKNHLNTSLRVDYEISNLLGETGSKQWSGMGYNADANPDFVLPQLKSALTHSLTDQHSLTGALSYGMRGPSTSELFGFYLFNAHDGFDYLGNPDLKAEKLFSAEAGYQFKATKWNTSATVYLQRYQNYIFGYTSDLDAMTWGANGVRIYENVDKASFYGFELSADYQPLKSLTTFAKAEYVRGFLNPGFNLPLIPPLQGSIGANLDISKWNFLAQSRMASQQNFYNSQYGDRYTPGYLLVDLAAGYEFKFEKVEASLQVSANNLLDTYYRDHLNWGGIPSMGRNFVFHLKLGI